MDKRTKIKEQIAFGIAPADVAAYHGLTLDELLADYSHEVNTAAIDLDVEVARVFYNLAMGFETDGNMQACVNWLKSRAQWDKLKERSVLPDKGAVIGKVLIETLAPGTDVDKLDNDDKDS